MTTALAQTTPKVEYFGISDVRLTRSAFKHAEDMDIQYLLALNSDRLLAPYLKGAGLPPKADNYTNWENTGLDGHIGGHYLSALSFMYAATGNEEIGRRLDYVLSELKRCQDTAGDGYLCGVPDGRKMWKEIEQGDVRAATFGLNDRWVPLYNIHKIYAGLRDAYLVAHREEAKDMLVKLTDWMERTTANLTDAQMQDMLRSEHGGLNETFADVAAITGDKRYLTLAHRFSHDIILNPLLKQEDKLTGIHANTQIPKVIGFKRIADIEKNDDWSKAADFFWHTVVNNRSITIGGNSVYEHFHPADNFEPMRTSEQGPETCNTYNMLRLTKMLYATSADAKYMDYYERALFNHILSTQDPVQGGFVYFTPMRSGHYRVYSQPQTSFWCCVGSGLENHARYGEMIYAHKGNDQLYVNLFIPSTLEWGDINIEQSTSFPDEEGTSVIVTSKKGKNKKFTLNIRVPEWVNEGELSLTINGKTEKVNIADGYVKVNRSWKDGDKLHISMPMHLRAIDMPDNSHNYSFLYGPIVLASRMGTQRQDGMFADDSRGGHIAQGPRLPLQNMPVVVGSTEDILSHITKTDGKMEFTLKGVSPENYEGMKLEPFYRIHESRYMVYWPVLSASEVAKRQEEVARQESIAQALEARTADKVTCGEQQPESDHFVKMEWSGTGNDGGVQWRETHQWFSYRMKTNGRKVTAVRIAFRPENNRDARVLINDTEIGLFSTADNGVIDIPVKADVIGKAETLTLKIAKGNKDITPHIYEVRLIAE
ncbi:MAG: glycoside hydrolase family 127 protein [Prevotella sp.]|nr:glycoside hydrolase family 127 protein [Prevotella sp.]